MLSKGSVLDPANKHKTFGKIIDEAYGHLNSRGKELWKQQLQEEEKMPKQIPAWLGCMLEYFEIMADPELKKEVQRTIKNFHETISSNN